MLDSTEKVWTAIKPLSLQKVKRQAKATRYTKNTVIVAYSTLTAVLILHFQGISTEIASLAAIFGLALTWLIIWAQEKRTYDASYQQEITWLHNIIQQEKQNSNANILGTIRALATAVDAKDHFTHGHSVKVAKYATEIAQALGYSLDGLERIRVAALLHDIGKIGIADHILNKPRSLSTKEWEVMRYHPEFGVAILKHIEGINGCLETVLHHHEQYDGSGYPAGLKGDDIPLDAQIMAVADAYDAMTSERPYRHSRMKHERAIAELKSCAGKQFAPQVVESFVSLFEKPNIVVKRDAFSPSLEKSRMSVALLFSRN